MTLCSLFLSLLHDRVLLINPRTVSTRAGKSPWKAPSTAGYDKAVRENLIFAFSEAHGWTVGMEDRYTIAFSKSSSFVYESYFVPVRCRGFC